MIIQDSFNSFSHFYNSTMVFKVAAKTNFFPNLQTIISAKEKKRKMFKRVIFQYFKMSRCLPSLTFYEPRMASKMAAK